MIGNCHTETNIPLQHLEKRDHKGNVILRKILWFSFNELKCGTSIRAQYRVTHFLNHLSLAKICSDTQQQFLDHQADSDEVVIETSGSLQL